VRVAVIGAGAIGGVVADAAAETGHDVTVCVRTPIESLEIVREGDASRVNASLQSSPSGPAADVVFLTVKATDTASTVPYLAELCGPTTLTVCVQNGIDHASRLAPYLPADAGPVAPAIVYIAAERVAPGRICHIQGNLLIVPDVHAQTVTDALASGMRVRGTEDIVTESWRKLLANLVGNPITALTMRRMDVLHAPGIPELARSILTEAVAVAQAEGAHLDDNDIERVLEGTARYGPETGSSMLYDRLAGRPMEHHYLTGEVVRRGAEHGIATPVNSTLLALLDGIDAS
jgi:2-dehydropantoate 2-reductase